jgi:hypothetical protein
MWHIDIDIQVSIRIRNCCWEGEGIFYKVTVRIGGAPEVCSTPAVIPYATSGRYLVDIEGDPATAGLRPDQ